MKIIQLDKKQATAKIELTRPEDCWVLTHVIEPGDKVRARTIRKIKKGGEDVRKQTIIKKPVTLTVEVEKTELSESTIRILGVIVDGPEDIPRGQHHTIALEQNQSFRILKPKGFKAHHLARLDEASQPEPNQILLVVHDREQAIIGLITSGVKILTHLKGNVAKKDQVQQSENFYKQLTKVIQDYKKQHNTKTVIIASPAFFKEDLIKEFPPELKKQVVQATCSSVTKNGIEEVLKRDELQSALKQDRLTKHLKLVEQITQELATSGKVAYGTDEVEQAANAGAITTLIVTELKIKTAKEENNFDRLDSIMIVADKAGAALVLMDSSSDPGKRVDGLGGIAALLRYKIN